jgi:alkyl hydroperoxide reductase subunit F
MYDLIIIGGGPAGVAAGIYAARKKINTLLITDSFGGQSAISGDIQNWIGTKSISGFDLAKSLEEHLRAQDGSIEIIDDDIVTAVAPLDSSAADGGLARGVTPAGFTLTTRNGKTLETKYVLTTSGSRRKKLGVPGEKEFDGKGVVYCSTCDAPLFGGKAVAVVGGGNSALESVVDLLPYAAKIYLLVRADVLKGDPVTQDKVKSHPNMEIILGAVVQEIVGKGFVTGLRYQDVKTNESKELAVEGVFVEIGLTPNADFLNGVATLNSRGEIVTDPRTQETSVDGIWAAGDVTDAPYRQNNISVGDAVKAVLNIYDRVNMVNRLQ